jgi:adenosylcobinamide-phosphate synthase
MSGIAVFSLLWFLLSQAGLPSWLWVAIGALGLKAVIALHRLLEAAGAVERALQAGDLAAARRSVGWNSVSRETDDLDVGHVASAAVESLAENPVDILVAPILAYALGGLPAAWAYRFVQTADAMIGYRDPRHEFLGKFAARLDDVLNWIPARLAGLLLVIAGAMAGGDWRGPGASCWNSMVAHRAPTPGGRWPPPAPWASAWRKRGRIVWTAGANSPAGRLSAAPADWWHGPQALVCSSAQR